MKHILGMVKRNLDMKGAKGPKLELDFLRLVYAVKDNRTPPNKPQPIDHALHPSKHPVMVERMNAIEYVTAMLAHRIAELARVFGTDDPRAITLVPVPSSEVTAATIETARRFM